MPEKPKLSLPSFEQVPDDLRMLVRWVGWRFVEKDGRWTKPPCNPLTGAACGVSWNWHESWVTFEQARAGALKHRLDGVGFVFVEGDGFVGIDFDHCVSPETGAIAPAAAVWTTRFETYAEYSPSGTGVHVIARGKLPGPGNKRTLPADESIAVEMYDKARFFTFTGRRLNTHPLEINDSQLPVNETHRHLMRATFEEKKIEIRASGLEPFTDDKIVARLEDHKKWGIVFDLHVPAKDFVTRYYTGDDSKADLALCILLARCTRHEEQVVRLWKRTSLWRDKSEREDYQRLTIERALNIAAQEPPLMLPWRSVLHTLSQLDPGNVIEYIRGVLPEGITFIGSLPGVGKTWFCLSMAKALVTGEKLFGVYEVTERAPVVYLTPEVGQKSLRKRAEKLRLPMDEGFWCQTISDGALKLDSPAIEDCISELKPVVMLDTAIRFNPSADENAASQNAKLLANDLFNLTRWGARAIVGAHHSPKGQSDTEYLTLENVLRGTGDIGAMCDAVWAVQRAQRKLEDGKNWDREYQEESERLTRLYVKCVKPRDFEPTAAFYLQGRPHIDEHGDFAVLAERQDPETLAEKLDRLLDFKTGHAAMSERELRRQLGNGKLSNYRRLKNALDENGWIREGGVWQKKLAF